MYYRSLIIREMQPEKLLALQLEKSLAGVKDEVLNTAARINDGVTRLAYYTSCFTDNYQDICAKLKIEDRRFLEGLIQLVSERKILHKLIQIFLEEALKGMTRQQLEKIAWRLNKLGVIISSSTLTTRTFAAGITTTVCLGLSFNTAVVSRARRLSFGTTILASLYGYIQVASKSADRLKAFNQIYYHALYRHNLEMMYFLVEPVIIKASSIRQYHMPADDIADAIYRMVR